MSGGGGRWLWRLWCPPTVHFKCIHSALHTAQFTRSRLGHCTVRSVLQQCISNLSLHCSVPCPVHTANTLNFNIAQCTPGNSLQQQFQMHPYTALCSVHTALHHSAVSFNSAFSMHYSALQKSHPTPLSALKHYALLYTTLHGILSFETIHFTHFSEQCTAARSTTLYCILSTPSVLFNLSNTLQYAISQCCYAILKYSAISAS